MREEYSPARKAHTIRRIAEEGAVQRRNEAHLAQPPQTVFEMVIHNGGEGYEVEFMTLTGETVAIVTLLGGQVRPLTRRDLAYTREPAPA